MHIAKFVIKCKYFDNHIVSHALAGSDPTPANSFSIFPCIFPPLVSWSFSRRCVQNYLSVKSLPQITVALHNSGKLCPPLNWREGALGCRCRCRCQSQNWSRSRRRNSCSTWKNQIKIHIYIFHNNSHRNCSISNAKKVYSNILATPMYSWRDCSR